MSKILIIDDEEQVRNFLEVCLLSHSYHVFQSETGKEGLLNAQENKPEVIILDLGLPDMPGLEVLKNLRSWCQTPIIVLTANNDPQDKVLFLDEGADDYLTKPFSVEELLARIRVCLRHSLRSEQGTLIQSGPLEIDFFHRIVKVDAKEVKLTNTEYELLRILAQNIGRVVTQQQLLREVWGPRSQEFTHYLRVYVAQLRKKIEKAAGMSSGELIHTETGVGYRLTWIQDK